jgi:hypothetical protein
MYNMAAPVLKKYFQTYTTDSNGLIDLTGPLNVKSHNTIDVEFAQWPEAPVSMTVQCDIGVISGTTLAQTVAQYPLGNGASPIQTFNVTGPEFRVVLTGGPANAEVPIQGWILLH